MIYHNDHIGRIIKHHGYYEKDMLNFIKKNIPKGNYIDVGANIGNHSVFFAKECGCKVFSFEPDDENFKLLEKNAKNLSIMPFNIGIGYKQCRMSVKKFRDNMGMNQLISGNDIAVMPLDSFNFNEIKLIKIDVEGMEMNVLIGAEKTINNNKPALFIETNNPNKVMDMFPYYKLKKQFNSTPTYYYDIR